MLTTFTPDSAFWSRHYYIGDRNVASIYQGNLRGMGGNYYAYVSQPRSDLPVYPIGLPSKSRVTAHQAIAKFLRAET